jgi:hypothetical protein
MLGSNGMLLWGWAVVAECLNLLYIFLQEGIKAEVHTKSGKIICIGQAHIIAVLDYHISTHKPHLEAKDGRVPSIIG